jgi:hypothetical protein
MRISMWVRDRERVLKADAILSHPLPFLIQFTTPDSRLVDVVLLPVEGGVGLDDDVLVRGLLQFVHEQGLAGF